MSNPDELHRAYGFSAAHAVLFITTIPTAVILLAYGLAVYLTLGVLTADVTAPLIMAFLLAALFALYRTGPDQSRRLPLLKGITKFEPYGEYAAWFPPVHKTQICDFCGMEFGGEKCEVCGRNMCDTCWVETEPFQRCPDCLPCPICRSGVSNFPCTLCGKFACRACIRDGVCIECASRRDLAGSGGNHTVGEGTLDRIILEPLKPITNAVLAQMTPVAKGVVMDAPGVSLGAELEVLGAPFCVIATSSGDPQAAASEPMINLVNREERDRGLMEIRKETGYPVCNAEGCNYPIRRRCVSCQTYTCPNHSDLCVECKKIVCQTCSEDGLCSFCANLARTGERPKLTAREVLSIVGRAYFLLPITVIFYAIFYYGESLDTVDPSLRLTLVLGIMIAGPAIAFALALLWALRRRSQQRSSGEEV